jgi:hydrogenase expression/formation protein HypE
MGVQELASASKKSVELNVDSVLVRFETERICAKYDLDPLGLLGSGALLATFGYRDAEDYVKALRRQFIQAAIVGYIVPGKDKSRAVSKGKFTSLSFSERDEVLKVLGE